MNALQFKVATAMAKDTSIPLPWDLIDCLSGCGLSDFRPVMVGIKNVASHLRYQCLCFDGSWDQAEFENCRAIFVGRGSKITVSDLTEAESRSLVLSVAGKVFGDERGES